MGELQTSLQIHKRMSHAKETGRYGGVRLSITAYSLGATEEVTGSKHVLEINGNLYMIDCGAWQGGPESGIKNREFEFPADKLSAIFLTHAHFDHCGLIPKMIKQGYKGKIYSTPATRDLSSIVMLDSAKIQKYEKGEPYYEEKDAIEAINHFRCHAYGKVKEVDENITYTAYDAGHILGSAMLDIAVPKKKGFISKLFGRNPKTHILYTGDLGRDSNPITHPPATDIPAPDYIFLESTYGDRTHETVEKSYDELVDTINGTIQRGGKVIIPSFAIERAQELIYHIKVLMADKRIPRVPVYIDSPMASNATGVFNIHPECFNDNLIDKFLSKGKNPFSVRSLEFVKDIQESIFIAESDKPCIVIAANGMCEAGRIINHLKFGIDNPKNTILIVGYMGEGTLGRKIVDGEEKVMIDKVEYNVLADVKRIHAFSAHADYKEIGKWLKKIDTSKLKKIFLVHGDKEAQAFLKKYLKKYKVEIVKAGESYILD